MRANGSPFALGGRKQRALLAVLLLHAGEGLSRDRLIDELWGEHPPQTASNTLQVHLSRLRRTLAAAGDRSVVVRDGDLYRLELGPGELDLDRFQELVAEGREALALGDAARAAILLRQALALWRGPPLADLVYEPFAHDHAARLEELRLAALKDRMDADLALGRHAEVVAELQQLAAEHPLDERVLAQLMRALSSSGRPAAALDAYRTTRLALSELGLEPGGELRTLESQIIRGELHAPRRRSRARRSRPSTGRRRTAAIALLVVAAAAGLSAFAFAGSSGTSASDHALRAIDPLTNEVVASVALGEPPDDLVEATGDLWVALRGDGSRSGTVVRVDPRRRVAERSYVVSGIPDALAASAGAVWAASPSNARIARIDPRTGRVDHVRLRHTGSPATTGGLWERWRGPCAQYRASPTRVDYWLEGTPPIAAMVLTPGAVWVGCTSGALERIDMGTGRITSSSFAGSPAGLAAGPLSVWAANLGADTVSEIDLRSGQLVRSIPAPGRPRGIAVFAQNVWVAACARDRIWRIVLSEGDRSVLGRSAIPVGRSPVDLVHVGGSLWVSNRGDGTVSRVDLATGQVVATIPVRGSPRGIAASQGLVWVGVQPLEPARDECASP
ncbi:MAG TPA: BTAD domain-containing putative transcriptional regulator [Gaiellaceae bacterium]|nr:BTAD domain-containing putative transcriptional regulator [Gaiellaceae bacterium]